MGIPNSTVRLLQPPKRGSSLVCQSAIGFAAAPEVGNLQHGSLHFRSLNRGCHSLHQQFWKSTAAIGQFEVGIRMFQLDTLELLLNDIWNLQRFGGRFACCLDVGVSVINLAAFWLLCEGAGKALRQLTRLSTTP